MRLIAYPFDNSRGDQGGLDKLSSQRFGAEGKGRGVGRMQYHGLLS